MSQCLATTTSRRRTAMFWRCLSGIKLHGHRYHIGCPYILTDPNYYFVGLRYHGPVCDTHQIHFLDMLTFLFPVICINIVYIIMQQRLYGVVSFHALGRPYSSRVSKSIECLTSIIIVARHVNFDCSLFYSLASASLIRLRPWRSISL